MPLVSTSGDALIAEEQDKSEDNIIVGAKNGVTRKANKNK